MRHFQALGCELALSFFFVIAFSSGVFAMNTDMIKISIEPLELDVRHLMTKEDDITASGMKHQEFYLDQTSSIFPKTPLPTLEGYTFILSNQAVINIPRKVTVEIPYKCLSSFSWKEVPIPVIMDVNFTPKMQEKGLLMLFMDITNKEIKKVPVYPDAWRNSYPPKRGDDPETSPYYGEALSEMHGRADYWNMTYFTDLPKYSVTYDFWLNVRGVDSVKKTFEIVFIVDGKKITPENFEKMAQKYPELKK